MKNNNSIAVIGGDSRQLYAAEYLNESGYNVNIFACEHGKLPESVNFSDSLTESFNRDIIILPLPVSKNGKTLNTPLSSQEISIKNIMDEITDRHIIFYGMATPAFSKFLKAKSGYEYDYFTSEELIYKNAYLTAEGILSIVLEKLPVTIRGTGIAITGYGRIGSFCADILQKLGAEICLYTSKQNKIAKAHLNGFDCKLFTKLEQNASIYDCIINTAPACVVNEAVIKNTKKNCILIESASSPYGIDFDACIKHNRQLVKAFSLPGKTAPKTAGIIIAQTIIEKLTEVK